MGRRLAIVIGVAALGAAVMAAPAVAFDHHFTVISKERSGHEIPGHAFRFKDRLFDPHNRSDKVGRLRGACRRNHPGKKCHMRAHLNGEIGGFGDIRFKGDLDGGPQRFAVVGGSDDFNGVGGKAIEHNTKKPGIDKIHFDLVR